jgi:hypothetical protein
MTGRSSRVTQTGGATKPELLMDVAVLADTVFRLPACPTGEHAVTLRATNMTFIGRA